MAVCYTSTSPTQKKKQSSGPIDLKVNFNWDYSDAALTGATREEYPGAGVPFGYLDLNTTHSITIPNYTSGMPINDALFNDNEILFGIYSTFISYISEDDLLGLNTIYANVFSGLSTNMNSYPSISSSLYINKEKIGVFVTDRAYPNIVEDGLVIAVRMGQDSEEEPIYIPDDTIINNEVTITVKVFDTINNSSVFNDTYVTVFSQYYPDIITEMPTIYPIQEFIPSIYDGMALCNGLYNDGSSKYQAIVLANTGDPLNSTTSMDICDWNGSGVANANTRINSNGNFFLFMTNTDSETYGLVFSIDQSILKLNNNSTAVCLIFDRDSSGAITCKLYNFGPETFEDLYFEEQDPYNQNSSYTGNVEVLNQNNLTSMVYTIGLYSTFYIQKDGANHGDVNYILKKKTS